MADQTLNETPRGSRLHIAIFGRRNAGKSSLINALTNQNIAIVSDVPGTTTDPVYKSMEILPIGPVVLIDTAGIDDVGDLGALRIRKTLAVLAKTDLMLLVDRPGRGHRRLRARDRREGQGRPGTRRGCPQQDRSLSGGPAGADRKGLAGAARRGERSHGAGDRRAEDGHDRIGPKGLDHAHHPRRSHLPVGPVVLVVPIDLAAPKGRLILPQVQTIRDILDNDAMTLVVKERELKAALCRPEGEAPAGGDRFAGLSQSGRRYPERRSMTSFSILFARYKGNLTALAEGARAIDELVPGDKVLIAEACTHHRVEDDIGTVKIPRWLRQLVGGALDFKWASGLELPADLSDYKLIVHCGACMINRKEMLHRLMTAQEAGVPMVNYGVLIAHVLGILPRALQPFPEVRHIFEEGRE